MKLITRTFLLSLVLFISIDNYLFAQSNQSTYDSTVNNNNPFIKQNFLSETEPNVFIKKTFNDNTTPVESHYSGRRDKKLSLQGYSIFKNPNYYQINSVQKGAIQDDYVLGVGDQVMIWLEGGVNIGEIAQVDRNGFINFSFTKPVSALGRLFSDVKTELETKIESEYLETKAFISISNIKQITATISGEVTEPGSYVLSGFSDVMDLILYSGGIKKTGSLRKIKLIQNNKIEIIDLYDIIFGLKPSASFSKSLKDGAILVVPPIGETIALDGVFSNPGIYEMNKNDTIEQFLKITGSIDIPEKLLIDRQKIGSDGFDEIELNVSNNIKVNNGDIFIAKPKFVNNLNFVELIGHAKYPTKYSTKKYTTLLSLIPDLNFLKENAYDFGVLIKNKNSYRVENLFSMIEKNKDINIYPNDKIYIFSKDNLALLADRELFNYLRSDDNSNSKFSNCRSISQLKKNEISKRNVGASEFINLLGLLTDESSKNQKFNQNSLKIKDNKTIKENESSEFININTSENQIYKCPEIFENNFDLMPALIENSVLIRGNIKNPGFYPININDKNSILELLKYLNISYSNIILSPDKKIIDVLKKSAKLEGAVRFPLEVSIKKYSQLSKLLYSADVLSQDAYPLFGIINRTNNLSGTKSKIIFNPQRIISKQDDILLKTNDEIKIFSNKEIKKLVKDAIYIVSDKDNFSSDEDNLNLNNNVNNQESTYLDNVENDNTSFSRLSFDGKNKKSENFDNASNFVETSDANKINKSKVSEDTPNNHHISNIVPNDEITNFIKNFLVEVSGGVINPGFYPIGGIVNLDILINEAGGFASYANTKKIEILNYDGAQNLENIVANGSSVFVPTLNYKNNSIKFIGELSENKEISYKENLFLSSIINDIDELSDEAYLYFASIKRKQSDTSSQKFFAFSPQLVLSGLQDIKLIQGDVVTIFSNDEILKLIKQFTIDNSKLTPEIVYEKSNTLIEAGTIKELVSKFIYSVSGSVAKPGQYLVAGISSLENLINISGGFTGLANKKNINIIYPKLDNEKNVILENIYVDIEKENPNTIFLTPGTTVKVSNRSNDLNLGFIEVVGAVSQPGKYRLLKGDTIFELLKRSGGLDKNAYLEGMIFTRQQEKERERRSIRKLSRELDKSISLALETQSANSSLNMESVMSLRELAQAASDFEPIGRVVGNFNNVKILKNTKVVSGDRIFIPTKPTSISVVGEVMSPGSIIWEEKKSLSNYIELAAGFTQLADNKKIFLIKPNGQAVRYGGLWGARQQILPGSTIVIPRRVKLSSTLKNIESVTSIIYQLTLSLAGIESVLND